MSFNTKQKTMRPLIAAILLVILVIGVGVVYALFTSIRTSNTVIVNPAVGLGVSISQTQPSSCPAVGDKSYGTISPYTNNAVWNFSSGGSQTEWFCLENQGSGPDNSPMIVLSSSTGFSCTATACQISLTTLPLTIPAIPAQSVSSPVAVTLSASPGTTGSGTVEITVS